METALVTLVDDLWRAQYRGFSSVLLLLDLSVGFDTIDHGILLRRLGRLGVGGTVLRWFSSYLLGHLQSVLAGEQRLSPRPLACGVPQGSVLSPLLFNIYMKPLGEIIHGFGVRYHQYADDTQLFICTPNQISDALSVMSRCLDAVQIWMGRNKLRLNPAKTEWLYVPASQMIQEVPSLVMGGEVLPAMDRVRNLGVPLDTQLSLEEQVGAVTRGAFAQVRQLCQLCPYLDRDALRMVTHVLVTSRIDYCNALYMGLPLWTTRRLQLVQNAATRVVMGVS
uniref:Reverse transcriptase domain-containing protein n=1 Tax=Naja naja TaxID=35670 RepID=A0A8C6Y7A4_NAJNA